jgi:hypothetical protein
MSRAAATVAVSVVGTLAAVLFYESLQPPAVVSAANTQELLQRMERLERAVNMLAEVRLGAATSAQRAAAARQVATPAPDNSPKDVARQDAAMRAGTAVIEQVVNTGRLTQEDSLALAVATTGLDGRQRAEVYARLSQAINEGRVRPDRDAIF